MPRGTTKEARTKGLQPNVKGQPRKGGREKGTPDKFSRDFKEALFKAAELSEHSNNEGLVGYLTDLANKERHLYCAMLSKLIPVHATQDVNHTVTINAKPEEQLSKAELREYYHRMMSMPSSSQLVIEHNPNEFVEANDDEHH